MLNTPEKTPTKEQPAAKDQSSDKTPAKDQSPPKTGADRTMAKPTVILVGADKGGVGKTTVTRTLLDYLESQQIPRRAFDTEAPKGTLKRFHPDITDVVDVTSAADQMKIFDTINAAEVTVIDVRAGLLSETLSALDDIGFLYAARQGDLNFAVFHILGPSISSLEEISDTADYLGGAHHFLVKNFINNTTFFEWDPSTYNGYFKKIKGIREISVPRLNELACERVELTSIPFTTFIANEASDGSPAAYSFVLRGYVRHWLQQVWAEYERVGLTSLVREKQKAA